MSWNASFQDALFSPVQVVRRTLASGTELERTLKPLPDVLVRVVRYRRKHVGKRWIIDASTRQGGPISGGNSIN